MTDVGQSHPARSTAITNEEAALWRLFEQNRSDFVRDNLFSFYTSFARQIAAREFKSRQGGDIEFPDFCQLGYAGLLEAIDRFDPGRGVPFKGFAARRITGSILDGLSKANEVRQQASFRHRVRAERARSLLAADDGRSGMSIKDAMRAFEDLAVGLALGFMLEDAGVYQTENMPDPRASAYESLAWAQGVQRLTAAISSLSERQQIVLRNHYFGDLDFGQIAAMLGVGKARVSQLHRAGIEQLKRQLSAQDSFRLER